VLNRFIPSLERSLVLSSKARFCLIVAKALYGLKSSEAAWRHHLANSIAEMGFKSSRGDPYLYYRPANKPDGTPCF